jgi:hypothetical protein
MQLRSATASTASTASAASSPRHSMKMRRDSRNYEEFDERRRYQIEQRVIEASIYTTEEEEIQIKKKHIYATIKHLLYAVEYQRTNNYTLPQQIETCTELFAFLNNNLPFIVDYKVIESRFATTIVKKGNYIIEKIHRKDKTRAQSKLFERCRYYIGNVIDLMEHHILHLY